MGLALRTDARRADFGLPGERPRRLRSICLTVAHLCADWGARLNGSRSATYIYSAVSRRFSSGRPGLVAEGDLSARTSLHQARRRVRLVCRIKAHDLRRRFRVLQQRQAAGLRLSAPRSSRWSAAICFCAIETIAWSGRPSKLYASTSSERLRFSRFPNTVSVSSRSSSPSPSAERPGVSRPSVSPSDRVRFAASPSGH